MNQTALCDSILTVKFKLPVNIITSSSSSQSQSRKKLPLPPSPPSDPIIGNARVMPLEYAYRTFGAWMKKYGAYLAVLFCVNEILVLNRICEGDLIYVSVLGRPMIIVNSAQAARDLMEKKGAIYSSRPRMEIMGQLCVYQYMPLTYKLSFLKNRTDLCVVC